MIGRVIGHFHIREKIGAGSMGEVYLAWDAHLRRRVAVKVLPPSTIADVVARQKLRGEALRLSRLNHPAVATLHDFLSEPDFDGLVMEYVDGESLDHVLQRGPLDEMTLLGYAVQLADGLAAAHEAGVVHRDIKPANIRITRSGRVKLLDFGLAKQVTSSASITASASSVSGSGEIAGTLAYMAPEVWSGQGIDQAPIDLFSFGVVLYEMATGKRPFQGLSGAGLVHAIKNEKPAAPRDLRPGISADLEAVILRLMSKRPQDRFPDARALHEELERMLVERRSSGARHPRFRGLRSAARSWMVPVTIVAVTVLALILWAMSRGPQAQGGRTVVIGVLPFRDLSGDSASGYFAQGVTAEITGRIAENDSLQVISRTSMDVYATRPRRVTQIAAEVGADRIVEGTIRRDDGQVRFSVQIVDGLSGRTRWSRSYRMPEEDIREVEEKIARDIVRAVGARKFATVEDRPPSGPVDRVAYELYLRGIVHLDRRTDDGTRQARAHFLRSLARDSTFAPAWAGLADAWTESALSGLERPLETFPHARRAALRAIELDPSLADGYASLGNILQNHDWNWQEAERAYRRAIALNPSHAVARQRYANHLALRGAFDASTREIAKARTLDPNSLPIAVAPGTFLYFARRYPEALRAIEPAMALDSTSWLVHRLRAANLDRLGREAEAMSAVALWLEGKGLPSAAAAVNRAWQAGGIPAAVDALIRALQAKRESGRYEPATHIAELHARLGRKEEALRWLAIAERERDTELNRLAVDPIFDPLRGDPRFTALVARVGLGDVRTGAPRAAAVRP